MAETSKRAAKGARKLGTEQVAEAEKNAPTVEIDPKAHLPVVLDNHELVVSMPDLDPYLDIPKGLPFAEWEKGADVFKQVRDRIAGGERVVGAYNDSLLFRLGDFLNHGIAMRDAGAEGYTDKFSQYEGGDFAGYSEDTVRKVKWVCKSIPKDERYREPITFKHHQIVAGMAPKDRKRWLDRALAEGMSANAMRAEIRGLRKPGTPGTKGAAESKREVAEIEPLEFSKEAIKEVEDVIYELYETLSDIGTAREKDSECEIDYEGLDNKVRAVNIILSRILLGIEEEQATDEAA